MPAPDSVRLGPADDVAEITAAQVRRVATDLIEMGRRHVGDRDILIVFDLAGIPAEIRPGTHLPQDQTDPRLGPPETAAPGAAIAAPGSSSSHTQLRPLRTALPALSCTAIKSRIPMSGCDRHGLRAAKSFCHQTATSSLRYPESSGANAERLRLPAEDFWIFDSRMVALLHFDDGDTLTGVELITDPARVVLYAQVRDAEWHHAVPYEEFAVQVAEAE
ncbi:DUF6879 family protein [Streptomyces sp. NPDC052496]|uniref:DUF6879 family protein n=1 Tax=Streptomyces sp. NPDC052496 TaxID=3154951 RepID=UPI0034274B60